MKIEIEVSSQRIADMMIGAIEGGSTYWCERIELISCPASVRVEGQRWYTWEKLYAADEFLIQVIDDEDVARLIRPSDLREGLTLMAHKHGQHFGDLLAEQDDALTADVFLQLITFKELIYG